MDEFFVVTMSVLWGFQKREYNERGRLYGEDGDTWRKSHNPILIKIRSKTLFDKGIGGSREIDEKLALVPIVGVFETREAADTCFDSSDLLPDDARWRLETLRIMQKVSDAFPSVEIKQFQGIVFVPSPTSSS